MKYFELAELYLKIGSTTKRLEKIEILSKFLRKLSEQDNDCLYLLLGNIYPDYDKRKIGISNQLVIKSLSKATGISDSEVLKEWRKIGDLGKVSEKLIGKKKQSTLFSKGSLTIHKVIENLRKLPELEGKGTISRKISLITELLTSATPLESLYLVRTLIGDLRIGIKESTVRGSIAKAFFSEDEKKKASEAIQNAYDKSSDLVKIFELSKKGLNELEKVSLEAGKPIKVMLAQKALSIEDGIEKCGKPLAAEFKYDGFRMLIIKEENSVALHTRRLENVTLQFPDIVEAVKKYVRAKSCMIDSEIIGYDPKTKKHLPFQKISQRIKRKYEIERLVKELPVEIKAFDLLFYNDKSLINEPFEKRSKLLKKIIRNEKYKITSSDQLITGDTFEIREFYKKAIRDNQEGLILKNLSAPYKPGSRVGYMLKLKEEVRDLDLVITGAEYGTGKRAGWLSTFYVSCRKDNGFLEVGKVSTGLKEKSSISLGLKEKSSKGVGLKEKSSTSQSSSKDFGRKEKEKEGVTFKELTKQLKPYIIEEEGRKVKIKPEIVVSVTYQEIQKSSKYSSGYALRFPRFTGLRPDRKADDASNLKSVEDDFRLQKK